MITRSEYARTILFVLVFAFTVYPVFSQDGADGDPGATRAGAVSGVDSSPSDNMTPEGESSLLFTDTGENPDGTEQVPEIGTFGVGDLLRMVIVLVLVAGAVYGVIALLRRRIPAQEEDADSPIQVLATRRLGTGNEVFAVMVGKSVFLLGGSDSGVSRLATIDDKETIDELVLAHSRTTPAKRTFAQSLGEWFSNLAVPGSQREDNSNAVPLGADGGIQRRLQRLRRM